MSELLPCPFCGNEALLLGGGEYEGIQQGYTVECHNCSATTAYFGADNMQEAIEAWNTRAEPIVRCKDCAKAEYGTNNWTKKKQWRCHKFSMSDRAGFPIEPNGFCAWGERVEGSE